MTSAPVASLPMYDWPEVQWANDVLWTAIAEGLNGVGLAAPETLDRARAREEVWTDPWLLLSQTCAWPYVTRLAGSVSLVGTPVYDVDGCAGPLYSSFLVTRADQPGDSLGAFQGRRFAINARDSLSGYVALRAAMAGEGLDENDVDWLETGGHRASLIAVADGKADLAAIDAVCWTLAGRHEAGAMARLRVVNRTPLRPGLPFVTSGQAGADTIKTIRSALREALGSTATLAARQALLIADVEIIPEADYRALAGLQDELQRAESRASRG